MLRSLALPFPGMPLLVEEDKPFKPKDIGLFSGSGVVLPSNRLTDLIEEFFRRGHFSLDLFQDVKYCIRQCINFITLFYSTVGKWRE